MRSSDLFVVIYFFIFIVLNILVGLCIRSYSSLALVHFFLIQIVNIGIAYNFTELLLSSIAKRKDLPKLKTLINQPPVALLYVTYDDACKKFLNNLKNQNYLNYDIFVLDDSIDKAKRKIVDQCDYKIVRRIKREGFKAGALNNWLKLYGYNYKYFIIADSDSAFDDDFIESMIKYGEHPFNQKIAIFQSFIINSNYKNRFPRILSALNPVSSYFAFKLFNDYEYIISWGHNNLHRTNIIEHVGGFDESFIAEDHAMGLKLIAKGYQCKLVNLISYEIIPETLRIYSSRQAKWARQDFELLRFDMKQIPFITKLHLFMLLYNHLLWLVYLIGIIIILFGHNITIDELIAFIKSFSDAEAALDNTNIVFIWMLYIAIFLLNRFPLAMKLGVPALEYFKNFIFIYSINYFSVFYVLIELFRAMRGYRATFNVTEKTVSQYSMIRQFKLPILFTVIILMGIYHNPISALFNFVWLMPVLSSPIVIYITKKG